MRKLKDDIADLEEENKTLRVQVARAQEQYQQSHAIALKQQAQVQKLQRQISTLAAVILIFLFAQSPDDLILLSISFVSSFFHASDVVFNRFYSR